MLNEDKMDRIQLSPSAKINRPSSSASNGPPTKKPTKQKRVLLELKRLNATIIDAAVKPEEDKTPCIKEYCAMGCICNSLAEESRLREHCGKAKCILECSCKSSNQSRIMRLETDGRTITTEDAFMLRRKATARLARMEKEFTSTVVLTGNETLLINETNNDKKRRCTKAPKRYEYPDDSDDEPRTNSPKKTALTTIDNEKNLAVAIKEIREPVYIKDSILEQLKHCTVNLVKLENMDNLAPWCMVHHLYKCFCKGRALEGKPMIIEKDENNTTIDHGEEEQHNEVEYKSNTKARYTFEKVEKNKKHRYEDEDRSDDDICATKYDNTQMVNESAENIENTHQLSDDEIKSDDGLLLVRSEERETPSDVYRQEKEKEKPKRNLEDVRARFYASRPECCRRQIPIPRRMFLYCNRKRRLNVLKYIKTNETEKTRLLLNEHVMRSVYYHKIDNENSQKRGQVNCDAFKPKEREMEKQPELQNAANKKVNILNKTVLMSEVVDLSDDEDKIIKTSEQLRNCNSKNEILPPLSSKKQQTNNDIMNIPAQNSSNDGVITMKKFGTLSGFDMGSNSNNTATTNTPDKCIELKLPKISNCFSLNAKANLQYPPITPKEKQSTHQQQHIADFTSATSVYSNAFNSSRSKNNTQQVLQSENLDTPSGTQLPPHLDNDSVRDVYNNVIRTMNSLVSKKMQDVDFALKRDSHIIPTPNADILCMMKWSNFLDAFCQGFAFIWQVKSNEGTYLVATVRNMLPMISDAMGVVNITALKPERLPLMGKMLLQNLRNEHTAKLAIVMQGKQSYWVVKGFLKAEPTTACNKPTPETHPALTKKINVLCTSLVKQRQKDEKNKELLAQRWPVPNKSTKVAQIMPTPRTQPVAHKMQQPVPPTQPSIAPPQITQSTMSAPPSTMPLCPTPSILVNNINNSQNPRKRKSTCEQTAPPNVNNSPKMDSYAKMSTNIEFRKVTREDIDEIHLPEVHKNNHKWLVLDLHNDFSHIFVPDFRDLVSLDRIQKVINFARQKNKIVKLQFFQNAPFDAFVTPKSGRKIYFGPLDMNTKPPTLILLQSVDGQMMLRELYQLKHSIQKSREEKTKAFWLLQMNGQTHFEVDVAPNKELENNVLSDVIPVTTNQEKNMDVQNIDNNDDDEDCMIIDEVDNNHQEINTQTEGRYNFTIGSNPKDKAISVIPQTNSLPGPPPIQTLMNTSSSSSVTITSIESIVPSTSSLPKIPNTNTVIKPVLPMPVVKPTTTPQLAHPTTTIKTGISTTATATNTITNINNSALRLPANAVVTGITTAPQEAPYSSTIFISASPNGKNQMPISHNSELSITKTAMTQPPEITEVITLNDDAPQQCETIAEKRRRVSLVCQNAGYDLNSQSIAVNAVINKILPENIQDIQVNKSECGKPNTAAVTSTIGSTTITKVAEKPSCYQQQKSEGGTNNEFSVKPVVFDVSFVDGMDEPAASIVIKPTTPTKPSSSLLPNPAPVSASVTHSSPALFQTVNVTASVSKTVTKPASCTTTSVTTLPAATMPVSNSITTTRIQKYNVKNGNNKHIGYKVIRIPSSLASAMSGNTGQAYALNKLICPKPPTLPTTSDNTFNTSSQQRPLLSKTVLNTTNPIKITPITPSPTTKATIKPLENVTTSITITPVPRATAVAVSQPKDPVHVLSPTNLPSRCVTIRQIIPKPTAAEVLPTTQKTQSPATTFKPKALAISTDATSSSASSTLSSLTPTYTTVNSSTIPSTSNSTLNTLNPPLAITSVQTLGTPTQKQRNQEDKTATNAALPSHIQYGYIVSPIYTDFKFVAKRVMEEFYVKVPSVGILKLMGLAAVNNYLNKHMLKNSDKNTNSGNWHFVAASKAIQMQNHQKSLMVRKTQSTGSKEIKLPTRLNTSKPDSSNSQKVVNVTTMSEPILIDD